MHLLHDEKCDIPCCFCFLCSKDVEVKATTTKSTTFLIVSFYFLSSLVPEVAQLVIALVFVSKPTKLRAKTMKSATFVVFVFYVPKL
jgi:hypothetical protein